MIYLTCSEKLRLQAAGQNCKINYQTKININMKKLSRIYFVYLVIIFIAMSSYVNAGNNNVITDEDKVTDKDSIKSEMEKVLEDMFSKWYPLSVDSLYGGFLSDINYKWEPDGPQNKMIVTQSRHIWSVSNIILKFPSYKKYKYAADHGFKFLRDVMWDKEYGGFYNLVTRQGELIKNNETVLKEAYGNVFAIYGLAAYFHLTKDSSVLNLAKKAFHWLDKHSYDPEYGGYFQLISREGEPLKNGSGGIYPKDYNSSIHILECFSELYKIWPDELLKQRLTELLFLIRDKMIDERGFLKLYFTRELTHVSFEGSDEETIRNNFGYDHITFGHDVETAFLLLEASETLGLENDTVTIKVAEKMVDHALAFGIDNQFGGLFDGANYFKNETSPKITKRTKEWWSQAEALNTFLLMSSVFPDKNEKYFSAFTSQWEYCKNYVIDKKFGDWYWSGIDQEPDKIYFHKSTIWKGNYHTSRSLINCILRLQQ